VFWIGVDEAGYGSRLGPLVVSASLWRIDNPDWGEDVTSSDDFLPRADTWSWQAQFQTSHPGQHDSSDQNGHRRATHSAPTSVSSAPTSVPHWVADSKKVYQSGQGLGRLQQIVGSLLTAIESAEPRPADGRAQSPNSPSSAAPPSPPEVWASASRLYHQHVQRVTPSNTPLANPRPYWQADDAGQADVRSPPLTDLPTAASDRPHPWSSSTLHPLRLWSRVVSEDQFNRGLKVHGNKANLLTTVSMELARQLLDLCPSDCHVVIDFDRHGGRKRYLPMLWQHFPSDWLQVRSETAAESWYRRNEPPQTVDFRFSVDGERRYPVAAASLASKYTRELAMHCLNAYWQCHIADLQPTAGYPLDAARWLRDVQTGLPSLPAPLESVWRNA